MWFDARHRIGECRLKTASESRTWRRHVSERSSDPFRINGWAVTAMLAALLVGIAWQLFRASRLEHELATTRMSLVAARLDATVADAIIEAQQSQFESARQAASAFFAGLQRQVTPGLGAKAAMDAQTLLTRRDTTVTALARSDIASVNMLLDTRARYRAIIASAGMGADRPAIDSVSSGVPRTP
jgi:hypothetical protein